VPEFEDELIMFIGNLQQLDDCLLHPLIATVLRDFVATIAARPAVYDRIDGYLTAGHRTSR
jgi:hypothetical protein